MPVVVDVVGGGFAGVEAAWACARRGIPARLFEMRPHETTPAHTGEAFAELVCSNSLKSKAPDSPAGLLKTEMEALGSLVIAAARETEVPGGQALTVDRGRFSALVTSRIESEPLIEVIREAWTPDRLVPGRPTVIATGPLSSDPVAQWLARTTGREHLHFYDAVSPTVDASTIDRSIAFLASRYGKGGDDYLNCPFNREEYEAFVAALVSAERVPIRAFEAGGVRDGAEGSELSEKDIPYFAGCMPIEAIAERGTRSLAFGNFKPVGLTDPRTGRRPYAVLQLRPENREASLYSLVACQNRLRFGEQKRVLHMVPGLGAAEFVRYGVIHRNTYVEAPAVLTEELELRAAPGVFLAGQLTGVEGYVESAAIGIWVGLVVTTRARGAVLPVLPPTTAIGSLLGHLRDTTPRDFAPMNVNWGLLPDPQVPTRDKGVRRAAKLDAARAAFLSWEAQAASSSA